MQVNRTKAALREGKTVVGPIISEARSVGTVKLMAQAGFDFLFFDMEHAMFDWETILTLVQTSLLCDITPLVRVTDLAYPFVARALDSGAQGIGELCEIPAARAPGCRRGRALCLCPAPSGDGHRAGQCRDDAGCPG